MANAHTSEREREKKKIQSTLYKYCTHKNNVLSTRLVIKKNLAVDTRAKRLEHACLSFSFFLLPSTEHDSLSFVAVCKALSVCLFLVSHDTQINNYCLSTTILEKVKLHKTTG